MNIYYLLCNSSVWGAASFMWDLDSDSPHLVSIGCGRVRHIILTKLSAGTWAGVTSRRGTCFKVHTYCVAIILLTVAPPCWPGSLLLTCCDSHQASHAPWETGREEILLSCLPCLQPREGRGSEDKGTLKMWSHVSLSSADVPIHVQLQPPFPWHTDVHRHPEISIALYPNTGILACNNVLLFSSVTGTWLFFWTTLCVHELLKRFSTFLCNGSAPLPGLSLENFHTSCSVPSSSLWISPVTRCLSLCIRLHHMMSEKLKENKVLSLGSKALLTQKGALGRGCTWVSPAEHPLLASRNHSLVPHSIWPFVFHEH